MHKQEKTVAKIIPLIKIFSYQQREYYMFSKVKTLFTDKALLSLILVLFINLGFMGYFCHKKIITFVDEGFSYGQSNGISPTMPNITENELCRLSPPIFHNQLTVQPEERFTYKRIKKNILTHPPLFYYILHTVSSFFPNTFSKWLGLIPNLLYFLLTQIALYLLSRRFLSPIKSLLPVIFYGFSVAAICTVVFIRNYMLLTLLTTVLLLSAGKIIDDNDEKSHKNLLYFCLTLFLGFLTHYYFLITAFILCAGICFIFLLRKLYKKLKIFAASSLASVGLCLISFSCIKHHLFSGSRGLENSILITLKENIFNHQFRLSIWDKFIRKDFFGSLLPHHFTITVTIIALIFLIYGLVKHKKFNHTITLLTVTLFTSVFIISVVIPLDIRFSGTAKRYFFNLAPLFALLFVLCLDRLTKHIKKREIWQTGLILLLLIGSLHTPDFQLYHKTKKSNEGQYIKKLKDKTLWIKISEPHENWKMVTPTLYSFGAEDFIIIKDFSDDCFQNMLKNENAKKHSALMVENTGKTQETCPVLKDFKLHFWTWETCAYLPEKQ